MNQNQNLQNTVLNDQDMIRPADAGEVLDLVVFDLPA